MSPVLTRRRGLALMLATPALVLSRGALAAEPPVYAERGVAIDGADAVAFFEGRGPVIGRADTAVDWNDARWHFASAANADAFAADPEAFAPRYGGYCAFAASRGYVASTVPEAWTLHDGKLYLNFSLSVRRQWLRDIARNIEAGDANWPGILG